MSNEGTDSGCESYELWGQDLLSTWMVGQDAGTVELVAKFTSDLTLGPYQIGAQQTPGYIVPVWSMFIPGTDVAISWWVDENLCRVWLLSLDTGTDLWGGPGEQ